LSPREKNSCRESGKSMSIKLYDSRAFMVDQEKKNINMLPFEPKVKTITGRTPRKLKHQKSKSTLMMIIGSTTARSAKNEDFMRSCKGN